MNKFQLPQSDPRGKRTTAWARETSYSLAEELGIIVGPTIEKSGDLHGLSRGIKMRANRITLSGGLRRDARPCRM